MNEPEFVRGNQKNYIRVSCDTQVTEGYDYQMCTNNDLESLLKFHKRTQNGENYLYYEISGLQSLDILLQTQKLKRTLVLAIATSIVKLCREFSEYVMDIEKIIWNPQYIMMKGNGEELRFVYIFSQTGYEKSGQAGLEEFLECCIEYLDYQDELLTEQLFRVYEALLDQKKNFILIQEMEQLIEVLSETEAKNRNVTELVQENMTLDDPFDRDDSESGIVMVQKKSKVFQKERRNIKSGLTILLVVDVLLLLFWKPLTVLKIFFSVAAGGVLMWLNIYVRKQDQQRQKELQQEQEESVYMEEYEVLTSRYDGDREGTCMITMEETGGVLYNLQNCEPQYIYASSIRKIIGKDPERVQIQLTQEGVSRIHAMIYREDADCLIEDLNSTNGTWINGKCLKPREPYVLKEGDRVRFAGMEYIFR